MLPDDFAWQPVNGQAGSPPDTLAYRRYEIARVTDRVGGGWLALLHYPDGRRVIRHCTGYEAGRAGCEAWALRHETALRAQVDRRCLEWLASQRWRGKDSVRARLALEALPNYGPAPGGNPSRTIA